MANKEGLDKLKEDIDSVNAYYEDKILEDLFNDVTTKNIKVPAETTAVPFKGRKYTATKWANVPSNWMPTSKGQGADFYWTSEPAQPIRAIDQRKEIEQDVQTVDFE